VGRAGIRRRKRKRPLPPFEGDSPGIIEDLEDQAEWSSYGQGIPRGGNPYRQAIWFNRGVRFYRNLLGKGHRRINLLGSYAWEAILVGGLIIAAFAGVLVIIVALIDAAIR
jgi:hypothetical protein